MVKTMEKIDVIYLSGGIGKRAKLGYPKQYSRIQGEPILVYGLEILNKINEIGNIIIPCHADYVEKIKEYAAAYCITKKIIPIPAGETRQQSVYFGLNWHGCEFKLSKYVLIAESVRPFITVDFVKKIINTPGDFVVPRSQPVSTVICDWGKTVDRDKCGEVQMPQKYLTEMLFKCHEYAIKRNALYTDDSELVICNSYSCGYDIKPKVIEGLEENIKITTPLDLKIAECIYINTAF